MSSVINSYLQLPIFCLFRGSGMLKLIALTFMIAGMIDVYLNSTPIGVLYVFAAISFFYLVIDFLMEELAAQD